MGAVDVLAGFGCRQQIADSTRPGGIGAVAGLAGWCWGADGDENGEFSDPTKP